MERIFNDAKDKNVAKVIVYVNSSKAYADAEHKIQLKTSELKDAFMKGCVLCTAANTYVTPINYTEASKVGTVSGVSVASSGDTVTAVRAAAVAD